MSDADETAPLAALDIFLPSPPPDHDQQEAFLDAAGELAVAGQPITVYLQDEDAWAFEECEPVRALLDSAGESALPITLLGLDIVVTSAYPTTEQMTRFARAGGAAPRPAERRCRARPEVSRPSSWASPPHRRGPPGARRSAVAAT